MPPNHDNAARGAITSQAKTSTSGRGGNAAPPPAPVKRSRAAKSPSVDRAGTELDRSASQARHPTSSAVMVTDATDPPSTAEQAAARAKAAQAQEVARVKAEDEARAAAEAEAARVKAAAVSEAVAAYADNLLLWQVKAELHALMATQAALRGGTSLHAAPRCSRPEAEVAAAEAAEAAATKVAEEEAAAKTAEAAAADAEAAIADAKAATAMQAIARGRADRSKAEAIKAAQAARKYAPSDHQHAVKLQTVARQRSGRQRYLAHQQVQSMHRGRAERQLLAAERAEAQAATLYRATVEREQEAEGAMYAASAHHAATVVQAAHRGRATRDALTLQLVEHEMNTQAAAVHVQSVHRGRTVRASVLARAK